GVDEFAVGDRVVSTFFPAWLEGPARVGDFRTTPGDGVDGYAREQITRPATWFTRQPEGYSHAEAATLTTAGLTAWRALVVDGGLKAGDTVLVLGTGGVSIFALQFARMMGARVIATSSSNEKLEKLKALGAEHVINYRETPEWGKKVKELTGGEGVDHIVEVGGPKTLPQSIDAVKIGGHLALIGILTGREGDIPTAKLMAKQATLKGLIVGSRRDQIEMIRAIEASNLRPIIDREFGLEEIADAFRHQESGKHFGKICLSF
ncbi:NAD(P)-dependent alcohol dehydrogenase, partial [Halomonas sp. 707D7]|uniref:zinc-dependent alcohol dehydrogenase family protein n=2 Tax=unclassified Halomonas TaxID=2609666 RepID=UPI00209D6818